MTIPLRPVMASRTRSAGRVSLWLLGCGPRTARRRWVGSRGEAPPGPGRRRRRPPAASARRSRRRTRCANRGAPAWRAGASLVRLDGVQGEGMRVDEDVRAGEAELREEALDALPGVANQCAAGDPLGRPGVGGDTEQPGRAADTPAVEDRAAVVPEQLSLGGRVSGRI